ncbi:MAG: alpha/beta fold hydrolase [Muribaculaceae bacterium]|nr:alpha/beta fold hydrolase [Muribaculaceae bacterium]
MKKTISLVIMLLCVTFATNAYWISGEWECTVLVDNTQQTLKFSIRELTDGTLSAYLDEINGEEKRIPCEAARLPGYYQIEIKVPPMDACFTGTVIDSDCIEGTFLQNGKEQPLKLLCTDYDSGEVVMHIRPQKPKPLLLIDTLGNKKTIEQEWKGDLTYREVKFGHDDVTLAGTLYFPCGNCPVVILVSGSGTQDRDGAMFGIKPYESIASYLLSRGVGVLCYDDRGAGESSPLKGNETTFDFAKDAQSAFDFLMSYEGINHSRIGYCGHSEGGQIAFINAANDPRVAFVISLAGPAVKGRDVMVKQNLSMLDMVGMPYTQAQVEEIEGIFDDIVNIADTTQLRESLRKRFAASTLQHYTDELIEQSVAMMTTPWYMTFVRLDPKPYLEKINCLVYALSGEWDFQVDAEQTFNALKASVKNVTCELLPEHNHMFQKCASKLESFNYATQGEISWTTRGRILDFVKGVYTKKQ